MRLFVRELRERGIETERARLRAGLSLDALDALDTSLALPELARFLSEIRRVCPDPALGLRAGQRIQLADLDLAGLFFRSANNVGEAIGDLREYGSLFGPARDVEVGLTPQFLSIRYGTHWELPASAVLAECCLAACQCIVRELFGSVVPSEVIFKHKRAACFTDYEAVFGVRPRFQEETSALRLPIALLERDAPHRDPAVRDVLRDHITRQASSIAAVEVDFVQRVRDALTENFSALETGCDAVARKLGMSESTLRRRLRAHGHRYRDLLHEVRHELALACAAEVDTYIDIARELGYADRAPFYRAFKRWTGMTLGEYRRSQRAGA